MVEWKLRPATAGDRAFLYALHRETLREYVEAIWGWDEELQADLFEIGFDPKTCSVVMVSGRDVGVLRVIDRADMLFISSLELLPDMQNQGIGTALINQVLAQGAQQKKRVTLQVLKGNPALHLYERLGFDVVSETTTHYEMASTSGPGNS